MKRYEYKGFLIIKNGTKEMPYNIYAVKKGNVLGHMMDVRDWKGFGKTIKGCKCDINNGAF